MNEHGGRFSTIGDAVIILDREQCRGYAPALEDRPMCEPKTIIANLNALTAGEDLAGRMRKLVEDLAPHAQYVDDSTIVIPFWAYRLALYYLECPGKGYDAILDEMKRYRVHFEDKEEAVYMALDICKRLGY
ncbi:MAG: hypothetical protein WCV84_04385 [Patescibacteria group bacterium]